MSARIVVIGGDGIGPEVVGAAVKVLEATGVEVDLGFYEAGDEVAERGGQPLPDATLEAARAADAVLFGAAGRSAADVILRLRKELNCYANIRPSRAFKGVKCLHPECDLVVVRENTECLYIGLEARLTPDVATATRLITRKASTRIARRGFEMAAARERKRLTAVHKANVMRITDGLFLEACREVARDFPQVEYEEALVDSVAMRMVLDPGQFDVLLTTNLFGDILSDLAAGLIGGLGLCPSANLGEGPGLFEPVHGSAPDIAGKGIANPTAAILCVAMMLEHMGWTRQGLAVHKAVEACLAQGMVTPDLGGKLTTMEMAREVASVTRQLLASGS